MIGLIATADRLEPELVAQATATLNAAGIGVKPAHNLTETWGNSPAGTPESRAHGVMEMAADPAVTALLAVKGGYGSIQVAGLLDWPKLAGLGKPIIGYSDTTYLLNGWVRHGLEAWHGPMLKDIALEPERADVRALVEALKAGALGVHPRASAQARTLCAGRAEGILWGGNLSVLASMAGSSWVPAGMPGSILFIEETGERIHKLDRWLHQLKHAGLLAGLRGVLVGRMTDIDDYAPFPYGFSVEEMLGQVFGPLGIPVVTGLACGHGGVNVPLPLGRRIEIVATKDEVTIR